MSGKIISKNVFIQKSFFKQATGLMFKRKMNDFAMIFPFKSFRKIVITMMFVFFPIDIIFLNSENKVIDIKENLKPFQFYNSKTNKTKTFIELPKGYISKHKIKLNAEFMWNDGTLKQLKA